MMKRSINRRWGKWSQQTAGRNSELFYIRGYNRRNRNSEVVFSQDEMDDLIYAMLNVKRR